MSSNTPPWRHKTLPRRRVLQGGGALVGAALSGCAAPSTTGVCDDALDVALASTHFGTARMMVQLHAMAGLDFERGLF